MAMATATHESSHARAPCPHERPPEPFRPARPPCPLQRGTRPARPSSATSRSTPRPAAGRLAHPARNPRAHLAPRRPGARSRPRVRVRRAHNLK
ncbi:hypothetical protein AG1IA_08865 [Rhizoctonia solani AG-1 IA]|uniref:Uncharacterized protein n=1 Tax=Thanatephorus cucumeris (strain AG1-IA) TaxID=983506 RepID=L8WGM0_THACA|nr:hypothetical protein AG1IA_08865 [Rhizoctonia solani AG-1 IA]